MSKKVNPTLFTQAILRAFMRDSGLEPRLLGKDRFRITAASAGRVEFELDIHKDHTNRLKSIHGGTLASLVDLGGSLAVASTGRVKTGVTTDLNVSYLNPGGQEGDVLRGTAICDKIGKTLAYTTVTFTNQKDQIAARGSHTKYVVGTDNKDGPFFVPEDLLEE